MTSKISCFKMIKFNIKQKAWYMGLTFLGYFVTMFLPVLFMNDIAGEYTRYDQKVMGIWQLGGNNMFVCMVTVLAALIGAWTGFSFLHSRKKMDFYGSMPVLRTQYFWCETIETLLILMSSYLINILLTIAAISAKGVFSAEMLGMAGTGVVNTVLFFLLFYFVGAVGMLLTGKIFTGILGTAVLLLLGPVFYMGVSMISDIMLDTFYGISAMDFIDRTYIYLSPLTVYFSTIATILRTESMNWSGYWKDIVYCVIMLFVMMALCIWLMKKRATESAERSMAFKQTEGPVKFILTVTMSILGGLIFGAFGEITDKVKPWYVFGAVFVFVITNILIEIIYFQDRKKIFSHKKWTLAAVLSVIAISVGIFVGSYRFDHWIPEKDQVEYAFAMPMGYVAGNWKYPDTSQKAFSSNEYIKQNMKNFNNDMASEIAEEGVELLGEEREDLYSAIMMYQMKDGSFKERRYFITEESMDLLMDRLLDQPETRKLAYPLLITGYDPSWNVYIYDQYGETNILENMTGQQKEEFSNIYMEELRTIDAKYLEEYEMSVDVTIDNEEEFYSMTTPLNRHFVESMKYLQDVGIDPEL